MASTRPYVVLLFDDMLMFACGVLSRVHFVFALSEGLFQSFVLFYSAQNILQVPGLLSSLGTMEF